MKCVLVGLGAFGLIVNASPAPKPQYCANHPPPCTQDTVGGASTKIGEGRGGGGGWAPAVKPGQSPSNSIQPQGKQFQQPSSSAFPKSKSDPPPFSQSSPFQQAGPQSNPKPWSSPALPQQAPPSQQASPFQQSSPFQQPGAAAPAGFSGLGAPGAAKPAAQPNAPANSWLGGGKNQNPKNAQPAVTWDKDGLTLSGPLGVYHKGPDGTLMKGSGVGEYAKTEDGGTKLSSGLGTFEWGGKGKQPASNTKGKGTNAGGSWFGGKKSLTSRVTVR